LIKYFFSEYFKELFGDIGAIRVARVHYDESGRSLGTAEVVYERRVDAVNAQKKYNTLNLDGTLEKKIIKISIKLFFLSLGRPMDIRVVGGVDDGSKPQSNRFSLANGGSSGRIQRFGKQNGVRGNRPRGGKQQNGTGGKKEDITADDLDADLDAYRAESKQKK
jgi:THO complex subunit 4